MSKNREERLWIVACDVDDVLWPLNETVTQSLGIPMERLVDFYAFANPLLTSAQQEALSRAYNNPDIFAHMEFYPGVEEILSLEELGIRLEFHSNCYGAEVARHKHDNMLRALPGVREDQLCLKVIDPNDTKKKSLPDNLLILVDDSPYNVFRSHAKVNVLPVRPYNNTAAACALMRGYPRCFVPPGDMKQLVEILRSLVIRLLGEYGPVPPMYNQD